MMMIEDNDETQMTNDRKLKREISHKHKHTQDTRQTFLLSLSFSLFLLLYFTIFLSFFFPCVTAFAAIVIGSGSRGRNS